MEYKMKAITENSYESIKENIIKNSFKVIDDHLDYLNTIDVFKDKKIDSCPYCGSSTFIKHGKFKNIQRYKCKVSNCSKTFSSKTNSPFSYSKKSITLWMKYLSLMNGGMSIRSCAYILGITIPTSFYWRHKILVAEASDNNFKILKDYVEVNKIMIKENFKGNKKAKTLNKKKIFIVCAMDTNNSFLSKAICRYSISLASITKNFYPNLDKSAFLVASGDRCLIAFAKKHNFKNSEKTSSKTNKNRDNKNNPEINIDSNSIDLTGTTHIYNIFNNIDNFSNIYNHTHNNANTSINNTKIHLNDKNIIYSFNKSPIHNFSFNIYRWLKRFKGVATKYLENYLSWYILEYKYNYLLCNSNQIVLFKKLNSVNRYLKIKDFQTFSVLYQYNCTGNY